MRIQHFFTATLLLAVLTGCAAAPPPAQEPVEPVPVKTITAQEAKARLDSADPVVLVDVRTAQEYTEGHIEGALLVDSETITDTEPALLPDKDAELLLYCRSGNRSAQAAEKLVAMGYTNVSDFGGIQDWPYETVTGEFVPPPPNGVLSSFSTTDVLGNAVDASILADYKLTAVNVWATFCGPCKDEMPDLEVLSHRYREQGLQVIALTSDAVDRVGEIIPEQVTLAAELAKALGVTFPVLVPSPELVEQVTRHVQAVPSTFFVDADGVQVGSLYVGAKSEAQWAEIFDELLAQVP